MFKDGEMIKEAFIEAADSMYGDFKNRTEIMAAINDIQLSRNTVTRSCEGIAENLEDHLKKDIYNSQCYSLQFDESTDIVDVAQLCIFIRMFFDNMSTKEKLQTTLHFATERTYKGQRYFSSFYGVS